MSDTTEEKHMEGETRDLMFKLRLNTVQGEKITSAATATHGISFVLDVLREVDTTKPKPGEYITKQLERLIKVKAAGIKYGKKHDKLERDRVQAEREHAATRNRGYVPDLFTIHEQLKKFPEKDREYGHKGLVILFDKNDVLKQLANMDMDEGVREVERQVVKAIFQYKPPEGSPFIKASILLPQPEPHPIQEFENDEDIPF